jgi:hypothetical protein
MRLPFFNVIRIFLTIFSTMLNPDQCPATHSVGALRG